jgi:hypothetical protein
MGTQPYLALDAYGAEYQQVAAQHYRYAQMAALAYGRASRAFELPAGVRRIDVDRGAGLQVSIFEWPAEPPQEGPAEVVVAFRGTDEWLDWLDGNLLDTQYEHADALMAELLRQYRRGPAPPRIVAVGHSLGGGLALHASYSFADVAAVVFNPSYRIHRGARVHDSPRVVIGETGDILQIQRVAWINPQHARYYERFYCTETNNHGIYLLARCLTHVAALNEPAARQSLLDNPSPQCQARNRSAALGVR